MARFERLGVRFVDDPDQAPPGLPLVLSAHGSAPDTIERATRRASLVVDAVCPLVTKVHHEIRTHARSGGSVVYIGHPDYVTFCRIAEATDSSPAAARNCDATWEQPPRPVRLAPSVGRRTDSRLRQGLTTATWLAAVVYDLTVSYSPRIQPECR